MRLKISTIYYYFADQPTRLPIQENIKLPSPNILKKINVI